MPGVILRDVARAAGCSAATASRALRGNPRIPAATRARVAAAAARLGYRPDPLLGALARYRTRKRPVRPRETIVLIDTWPAAMATARPGRLIDRCASLGFALERIHLGTDPAEHRRTAARLLERGIRGLLLGTGEVQQDELDLPWDRFACVSVSGAPRMRFFPSVTANYAQNIRLVLAELQQRGYRRPGLVLDTWILQATREACLTGWGHAFAFAPDAPARPLILDGRADGRALGAWLAAERPDAVIAPSAKPLALLRRMRSASAGTGFASLDAAPRGGVAGIVQPREACQLIALDLLAARLAGNELGRVADPYAIQVEGRWLDGPTVRPRPS
jgi:LacI family transcriptional regulator